jgi:hypothetical protein
MWAATRYWGAHDILSADEMARARADALKLPFDPLDDEAPAAAPILEAMQAGILGRVFNRATVFTIAPRGKKIRELARIIDGDPALKDVLRFTSPERMAAYIQRAGANEVAYHANAKLRHWRPNLSAASRGRHGLRKLALLTAVFFAVGGYFFPNEMLMAAELILGTAFLSWIGLRLHACQMRRSTTPRLDIPDRALPNYSVVVALYREVRVVAQLADALRRLVYPREKLDIKFICEADDRSTIAALEALDLDPRFEIMLAPVSGPRTKPKALTAALPFVRGKFLVVYDAEDIPEPDQLRKALAAYYRGPKNLACVQAKLAVDNVGDNWLTRHFAAEYAGLFDVFLPALADLDLPLPLGGTSNHFRTDVLRKIGAWDPYNVTEDADLGMRLARFGYLSSVIDSTTYEEAPARLGAWLKQRTRWCKGWLQTWLLHMRSPASLLRELGFGGFFAFQLLVGGTVLAALVHPFFLAGRERRGLRQSLPIERECRRGAAAGTCGHDLDVGLSRLGHARAGWTRASKASRQRLGAALHAGLLDHAFLRGLARRDPARDLAAPVGKNRTRPRAHIALRQDTHETAAAFGTGAKGQRHFRKSAAASSAVRCRLNGAMKRPFLSIRYTTAV